MKPEDKGEDASNNYWHAEISSSWDEYHNWEIGSCSDESWVNQVPPRKCAFFPLFLENKE